MLTCVSKISIAIAVSYLIYNYILNRLQYLEWKTDKIKYFNFRKRSYRKEITDKLRVEFQATPFEIEVSGSVEIFIRS